MKRITIVVIAFLKQGNKYLMTKRYDPKDKLVHNTWHTPGGGLKPGETLEECLKREFREEIGAEIIIEQFVPYINQSINNRPGWHGLIFTYLGKLKDPKAKLKLNHEASEYAWLTLTEIKHLPLHFGFERIIKAVEKFGVGERT